MNLSSFIAKRVAFNGQKTFSKFIIRLATAATALSVAAMIITLAFVNGFQQAVSHKIFSFSGHLHVQQYNEGQSLIAEEAPLEQNDTVVKTLYNVPGITHVQAFATKSAVVEKNKEIEGILFKGIDSNYDFKNLQSFLIDGSWIDFKDSLYSKQIMLSKPVAERLKAKAGDSVRVYFIEPDKGITNVRKLQVKGIFKTGIEEYDKLIAIGDIRLLRRVNNWQKNEIGGYEVFLDDYKKMDTINKQLYTTYQLPDAWVSKTIRQVFPNIFDWLDIQDVNRNVIFLIMSIVAIINLVTCLLILVLERTRMVGLLKALGSSDWSIQQIFLYHATIIAGIGIAIGFSFGVGICLLQQHFGFISLDESAYYVSTAPIQIIWWQVWLVCGATLVVCFIALLLPTIFVKTIKPVKAIQFR